MMGAEPYKIEILDGILKKDPNAAITIYHIGEPPTALRMPETTGSSRTNDERPSQVSQASLGQVDTRLHMNCVPSNQYCSHSFRKSSTLFMHLS